MNNIKKTIFKTGYEEDTPPPGDCLKADVTISAIDIGAAIDDGTVYIDYTNCSGAPATASYADAGFYVGALCVDPQTAYAAYYYVSGEATNAGSSGITVTGVSCDE